MGLRIQNNVEAFNAHRQLTQTSNKAAKAMERLSSGYRVNRASDDAAGLAISEKMRSQIGGLQQAQRNAQDGVSLVQTAEGALTEVHSMLQRVRDLVVQRENGTLDTSDKEAINKEIVQLASEIYDISENTQFNGKSLLNGTQATLEFQVGANDGETISAPRALISLRMAPRSSEFSVSFSPWTLRSRMRCSIECTSVRAPSAVWTSETPSCALR